MRYLKNFNGTALMLSPYYFGVDKGEVRPLF